MCASGCCATMDLPILHSSIKFSLSAACCPFTDDLCALSLDLIADCNRCSHAIPSGVETTKTERLLQGKVPLESRTRLYSPRHGHFSVSTPSRHSGRPARDTADPWLRRCPPPGAGAARYRVLRANLGRSEGMETTKSGRLHQGKVPLGSRTGPSNTRYDHFLVLTLSRMIAPKSAQNDKKRTRTGGGGCAAFCSGAETACHAPPVRRKAARTRTRGPRVCFETCL